MLQYKKIVVLLSVISLAAGLTGAPAASSMEGRSRAIDLLAEGQTLENQGDPQGAYQKYYKSAQLAPSPSACYHLGRLARLAGRNDSARKWLEYALRLNPTFELAKVELLQLNDGAKKAAPVVQTVTNELERTVAPGTADTLNTPMNVDALRREVLTMQSLAPPENLGAAQDPAPTPAPASPQDIVLMDPETAAEPINKEVSSLLSPTIDPSEQDSPMSLPSLAESSTVAAAAGAPSRAEINEAAFGPESQKDPGSKGYGQTTKVVLGTYAFHREKGDDYRKANRWREAAVEYKTAIELAPESAETRALLAEMYGRIGDAKKAERQFDKAKAQAPQDDRIYYKEGNTHFDEQEYDLAIGSYRKALDLNPENKFAMNNLGVTYMEKKDYTKAAERFKQVLEIDPAYQMAVLNLGIIYDEHMVDKEQALKYYDRYLELDGPRATEVQRWADSIRAKSSN